MTKTVDLDVAHATLSELVAGLTPEDSYPGGIESN